MRAEKQTSMILNGTDDRFDEEQIYSNNILTEYKIFQNA